MKLVHRVSMHMTPEKRRLLERIGVNVGDGLVTFEVDESDPRWPRLAPVLAEWEVFDFPYATFSATELEDAEWLELAATWHHRYPQPREGEFGYLDVTYDVTGMCPKCHVGAVQNAPFWMRTEPKWGRRSMLQLNWVFDEFFVKPELWEAVFQPLGIGCSPVLNASGRRELKTVVQLDVPDAVDVDVSAVPDTETCPQCGVPRCPPVSRDFFPPLLQAPRGHAVRTRQWFGSGGSANRPILVSHTVFARLRELKVRGVDFIPVARSEG